MTTRATLDWEGWEQVREVLPNLETDDLESIFNDYDTAVRANDGKGEMVVDTPGFSCWEAGDMRLVRKSVPALNNGLPGMVHRLFKKSNTPSA
jgi:hypothetical protein